MSELKKLHNSWDLISSLEFGEYIYEKKGHLSKYESPYPAHGSLEKQSSGLEKLLINIETGISKAWLLLCRRWSNQTTKKNIDAIDKTINATIELLKSPISPLTFETSFKKRTTLYIKLFNSAYKSLADGLSSYSRTIKADSNHLCGKGPKAKQQRIKDLERLSARVQEEVIPLLKDKISESISYIERRYDRQTQLEDLEHLHNLIYKKTDNHVPKSAFFTQEAFRLFYTKKYGRPAVDRALRYYHLEHKILLTPKDIQALTLGIAANLTYHDLESVFANKFDPGHQDSSAARKEFLKQSDEQLCELLDEARQIDIAKLKPEKASKKYREQLAKDLSFLEACDYVKEFGTLPTGHEMKQIERFGAQEHLARQVSYSLLPGNSAAFPDGVLFPAYDMEKKAVLREAYKIIAKEGINALSILPARVRKDSQRETAAIVFRGTYDRASMQRDLYLKEKRFVFGFEGPGGVSFQRHKQEMLAEYKKHIAILKGKYPKGKEVQIEQWCSGHSLGATDAFRMLTLLTEELTKKRSSALKSIIQQVRLVVFNPPGFEYDQADCLIENIRKLPDIKFDTHIFKGRDDPISLFGIVMPGFSFDGEGPANLTTSIIECDWKGSGFKSIIRRFKSLGIIKTLRKLGRRHYKAHVKRMLTTHKRLNSQKENTVRIRRYATNNPAEREISSRVSAAASPPIIFLETQKALNEYLVTPFGRFTHAVGKISAKKARQFSRFFKKHIPAPLAI